MLGIGVLGMLECGIGVLGIGVLNMLECGIGVLGIGVLGMIECGIGVLGIEEDFVYEPTLMPVESLVMEGAVIPAIPPIS